MARKVQVGPEGRAGWKEEWSWKDKNGVWRKRTIYGSGVAKLGVARTTRKPNRRTSRWR